MVKARSPTIQPNMRSVSWSVTCYVSWTLLAWTRSIILAIPWADGLALRPPNTPQIVFDLSFSYNFV